MAQEAAVALSPEQRKRNLRLGLILATVALAFVAGFVARLVLLGT